MRQTSSSLKWLCGDTLALGGHWRSSCIVSVRTNRVANKHQARSINALIKTETGLWRTEGSTRRKQMHSEVMNTIQSSPPPHHHNSFVATCQLWTAILALKCFRNCPSKAKVLPQSYYGDEEVGCFGFVLWLYYECITLFAFCLLSTLCVMNQFLF